MVRLTEKLPEQQVGLPDNHPVVPSRISPQSLISLNGYIFYN